MVSASIGGRQRRDWHTMSRCVGGPLLRWTRQPGIGLPWLAERCGLDHPQPCGHCCSHTSGNCVMTGSMNQHRICVWQRIHSSRHPQDGAFQHCSLQLSPGHPARMRALVPETPPIAVRAFATVRITACSPASVAEAAAGRGYVDNSGAQWRGPSLRRDCSCAVNLVFAAQGRTQNATGSGAGGILWN